MKLRLPFLAAIILFFAACQKEITSDIVTSTSPTTTPGTTGSFTANINGTPWIANRFSLIQFSPAMGQLPRLMNISAVGTDKRMLTITLTDSGAHQYSLSPYSYWMNAAAYIDSNMANPMNYSSNQAYTPNEPNGTFRVSSIDTVRKTMSGTFSFKVYRQADSTSLTFSNGVFTNVSYSTGSPLPPSSTSDTFRVKVNGTSFVPHSISGDMMTMMNSIMLQGNSQDLTRNVSVGVPMNATPGTYPMLFPGDYYGAYMMSGNSFSSVSGSIQVLEHNTTTKRIRANFAFVAQPLIAPTPVHNITEGYFSIIYR
ncbi:DUF6252 family protein [Aridibaculum aurantiacum]|uniref:DUF6252 family protein n=1 Tax=Aridibaculum aurantiacum TaxID=2810307 RepID=UPI001A959ABB|nr:DUF6252 family protein [Aridibaculum aurantiacum]